MTSMTRILPPLSFLPARKRLLVAALAACFVDAAHALPVGPQTAAGAASYSQNGNLLTINNSNNAILNWQSFNIAAGEAVRFNQTSASSSVLNRVLGSDPSVLFGQLSSNGRVWLINPAGILVGAGGRIDTAGFVASTLNIRNEDFLAGRLNFQNTPGAGSVVNQGDINVATPGGGSVYLIAPNVSNEGIITTPQGETILAAGQTVELIDTATPGVKVKVTGATGNATNLGSIVAEAGRVGMVGVLVRNSGKLNVNANADSVVNEGGRIFLKARQDTYVDKDARLSATGGKGGAGGRIEVLGNRVAVTDNASLDASGQSGGGTVLVGGDNQGKNPDIQNASITHFGKDASIKADALQNGDGGKVIVWADDTTRAYGSISVRGGAESGNGGFVETSGKKFLDVGAAYPDVRASKGGAGSWLLDPEDIVITSTADNNITAGPLFAPATAGASILSNSTLNNYLASSGDATVDTTGGGAGTGNINISSPINPVLSAARTLTLKAHADVIVNSGGPISATGNALNVSIIADQDGNSSGQVSLNDVITTNGGSVNIASFGAVTMVAAKPITTGGGMVNITVKDSTAAFNMPVGSVIASGGGTIGLIADKVSLLGSIDAGGPAAGVVVLKPVTLLNPIDLVTSTTKLGNSHLELLDTELATIKARTLVIGDSTPATGSGDLTIAMSNASSTTLAINPGNVDTLVLSAAGNVAQNVYSPVSVTNLAVKALGDVGLANAANMVTNVAAQVGDVSNQNKNFSFKNGQTLNVGSNIDGVSGIAINTSGTYSAVAPDAVIALTSSGALTQSAGALLGGKAVYAEGSQVTLTNANPTGVIAGKATGSASSDVFSYASSNGIQASTVNAFAGIQAVSSTAPISVVLSAGSAGIGQDSAAPISAGSGSAGLSVATSGPVNLMSATNSIGSLSSVGNIGQLDFTNTGAMALDGIVTTSGSANIDAGGLLTIKNTLSSGASYVALSAPDIQIGMAASAGVAISGSGIKLLANKVGTAGTISTAGISASTLTSSNKIEFEADNHTFAVAPVLNATNEISYKTHSDNRSITVGTACNAADPSCLLIGSATHNAPDLVIGDDVVTNTNTAGNIHVDSALSNASGRVILLSGGGITQTAAISATGLAVSAGGAVVLDNSNAITNLAGKTSSGGFSFTNTQSMTVNTITGGANSISGVTAIGAIALKAVGASSNLTLNAPISSAATGNAAVLAAGGSFTKAAGSITLTGAGSPRWLVYAASPASVTKNGLTSAFRHYSATYVSYPTPSESGNGFIYASAPGTLSVNTTLASGAASNAYGAAPTAVYSYSFSNAAIADSEDLALIGGAPTYSPVISSATAAGAYTVNYSSGLTSAVGYGFTVGSGLAYTVDPAALTVVTAALTGSTSKTYDATTSATLKPGNFLLSGFVGSDNASVTKTSGDYASKNVGSGILVSTALTSADFAPAGSTILANYTLPASASGNIGSITPAAISVSGVMANDRVYDATTSVTFNTSAALLSGVYAGDVVGVSAASGSFADKNIGKAKPVTLSGIALSGTDAGNYTLDSGSAGMTASIFPANLSISGVMANDRVYDATTSATFNTSAALLSGVYAGDVVGVSAASGSFADKNVGKAKPVTLSGITLSGADASNYTLGSDSASMSASITPATLDVIGIKANGKVYDATTAATLDASGEKLVGIIGDDMVDFAGDASVSFVDKNVGKAKAVTVSGIGLVGADAGNYSLSNTSLVTAADITPATIANVDGIVASDKAYDGTVSATLDAAKALFKGMFGGDALKVGSASGSFSDKAVGNGKMVNINGITLAGPDAGNYILAKNTATTSASITPNIPGDKVYDGAKDALLNVGGEASVINPVVNSVNSSLKQQRDSNTPLVIVQPKVLLANTPSFLPPRTIGGAVGEFGSSSGSTGANANAVKGSSEKDVRPVKKDKADDANGNAAKKPAAEKAVEKKLPMCS